MMTPPTDRLHKFLAIAGLVLITTGFTYAVSQYDKAELKRIDALEQTELFVQAYGRYAEKVNEQILLYNRMINEDLTKEKSKALIKDIFNKESDVISLNRAVQNSMVQSRKQIELMEHYYFMRNFWFVLGVACVLTGTALSFIGFRQWLAQPKLKR